MAGQKAISSKQTYIFWLMAALVLGAQGLYFSYQWLTVGLVICGALIWSVHNQKYLALPKDTTVFYLGAIILLHLLALVYAAERGMLAFGIAKYVVLLAFYIWLYQNRFYKEILLKTYGPVMTLIAAVSIIVMLAGGFENLGLVVDGRLSGSFQYANTMAIMFGLALILLMPSEHRSLHKYLMITVLMVALLLTYSRGGIILSLGVLFLYMLITVRDRNAWLVTAGAIVLGFGLMRLIGDYETAERLVTHGSQASEWQTRLLYYKDGLTMLRDRWYGFGTNGYHYVQSFYQTGSVYSVKYIHSGLLQMALDVGGVGGVLTGFWMLFTLFKQKDLARRVGLFLIFAHSCVDFDLQYGAVWLVILLLSERPGKGKWFDGLKTVYAVTAGLMLAMVYLLVANLYYENENYLEATDWYPAYTEAYRQLMKSEPEMDEVVAEKARDLVRQNPYVTEGYEILREYALGTGDYQGALMYSELSVYYRPIAIENYEIYSHMLILNSTYAHAYGRDSKAKTYLDTILQIPDRLGQLANERDTDYNVNHKPRLYMNKVLMKDYVEAGHLMDEITGP